ncbi:hypothetical protein GE061_013856 [Apolygus lucorum]|uniref:Uncharacterized protein n=1 Tax=Apolygus lucorum TaxID=248454 RepID=A0A8S9XRP0_APOLU|nr:hypothetical protein GE061_013856 [Apolygus lucorum]
MPKYGATTGIWLTTRRSPSPTTLSETTKIRRRLQRGLKPKDPVMSGTPPRWGSPPPLYSGRGGSPRPYIPCPRPQWPYMQSPVPVSFSPIMWMPPPSPYFGVPVVEPPGPLLHEPPPQPPPPPDGRSTADIIAAQSQDYIDEKLAEYQATIFLLQDTSPSIQARNTLKLLSSFGVGIYTFSAKQPFNLMIPIIIPISGGRTLKRQSIFGASEGGGVFIFTPEPDENRLSEWPRPSRVAGEPAKRDDLQSQHGRQLPLRMSRGVEEGGLEGPIHNGPEHHEKLPSVEKSLFAFQDDILY